MTLQQAVDIIKRLSHRGDTATTSDVTTSIILDSINATRRELSLQFPKLFSYKTDTFTTVAGTQVYSLNVDVLELEMIRYQNSSGNNVILKRIDSAEDFYGTFFTDNTAPTSKRSAPTHYWEGELSSLAKRIRLDPIPDAAYTVVYHYWKQPTTDILTTTELSAAIPEIPVQYHNVIWKGGLYYVLKAYDDPGTDSALRDYKMDIQLITAVEDRATNARQGFLLGPMSIKRY